MLIAHIKILGEIPGTTLHWARIDMSDGTWDVLQVRIKQAELFNRGQELAEAICGMAERFVKVISAPTELPDIAPKQWNILPEAGVRDGAENAPTIDCRGPPSRPKRCSNWGRKWIFLSLFFYIFK